MTASPATPPRPPVRWSAGDLPASALPLALHDLHAGMAVGATVTITVADEAMTVERLHDVVVGAGFEPAGPPRRDRTELRVAAVRQRTLADTVGADMRLLVCGLNPSLVAADAGVGFARPGNRFWPAALASGLVSRDRDPVHALVAHGVGMTDLVKHATPRADALTAVAYGDGMARVQRLVGWLRPGAVCFVGLAGWRAAVDRRASPGVQPERIADAPVYVMPSTSGVNARVGLEALTDHLRAASALALR